MIVINNTVTQKILQPSVCTVIASSFCVAVPAVWNNFPHTLVTSSSVRTTSADSNTLEPACMTSLPGGTYFRLRLADVLL